MPIKLTTRIMMHLPLMFLFSVFSVQNYPLFVAGPESPNEGNLVNKSLIITSATNQRISDQFIQANQLVGYSYNNKYD